MARLLFIGLWNFCDDGGVHPASVRSAKMEVFPGDEFTPDQILEWISELLAQGLFIEFKAADGKNYWKVALWEEYQKIDRPAYKYPQPQNSTKTRRTLDESSSSVRETPPPGREGKGKESKGGEWDSAHTHEVGAEIENEAPAAPVLAATPPPHAEGALPGGVPPDPEPAAEPDDVDEFSVCKKAIVAWAQPNDWAALRLMADAARYNPTTHGPVAGEINKLISHYLGHDTERPRLLADPVRFFRRKMPGWLENAKSMNRPNGKEGAKSARSGTSGSPPLLRPIDEVKVLAERRHGAWMLNELRPGDWLYIAQAPNEGEMDERMAFKAKKALNGQGHGRTGLTGVNDLANKFKFN